MEIKEGQVSILTTDGKTWKKRHCVLKNRILYVYENKSKVEQDKILHFIPLARCGVITTALKGPNGRPFCFKVSHQIDDSIQYWMSSDSEEEMKDWVPQMQQCCAVQKEPEPTKENFRNRSKSVAFKPGALQMAGISDFSGWLKKQANAGLRKGQWKKRWFVLKDMILYYYEGPEAKLKDSDKYLTQPPPESPKSNENDSNNNNKNIILLNEWLSTLSTLSIQEPCQFLYNVSFVIQLLDKLNIKVTNIGEKPDTKEKEREWLLASFDSIIKTVQSNNIKLDSNLTSHDFINRNSISVLGFAQSLYDFAHNLNQNNIKITVDHSPAPAPPSSTTSSAVTSPSISSPPLPSQQSQELKNNNNNENNTNTTNTTNSGVSMSDIDMDNTTNNILEILDKVSDSNTTLSINGANEHGGSDQSSNASGAQDASIISGLGGLGSEQPLINELLNADEFIGLSIHSTPNTPAKNPPPNYTNKFISPHRAPLKRVETKDVIGEFDKMFSTFGSNLKKCGKCNEPITGDLKIDACGKSWHPHHLFCSCCNKHLIDVEDVPYIERSDKLFCKECHDKSFSESHCSTCNKSLMITFAHKGKILCNEHYAIIASLCQKCEKPISDLNLSFSIDQKKWHQACFSCTFCKKSLSDPSHCVTKNSNPYCHECNVKLF
ncbi:prespore-specific protein [Cavenderia fasciculata]|uniref:Prespore-specific protein n=1 Tax=Cavenderia fasciculata TaxID=261658 RepID=F4PSU2_CACFS|nr:prespore-specific protein [Cavenderia fasciculata]EGG21570.1 prespore-specific protein [Cavenderia fasciculata]|eukprot:XP_004359420.1 prespore-specific protein [Cavenderia fasciculata]